MKAIIPIVFEVPDAEDQEDARAAAEQAAIDFLAFVKVSGYSSEAKSVTVHVDGVGELDVELGDPVLDL